jgi:hypothetical protein
MCSPIVKGFPASTASVRATNSGRTRFAGAAARAAGAKCNNANARTTAPNRRRIVTITEAFCVMRLTCTNSSIGRRNSDSQKQARKCGSSALCVKVAHFLVPPVRLIQFGVGQLGDRHRLPAAANNDP